MDGKKLKAKTIQDGVGWFGPFWAPRRSRIVRVPSRQIQTVNSGEDAAALSPWARSSTDPHCRYAGAKTPRLQRLGSGEWTASDAAVREKPYCSSRDAHDV